MLRCKMARFCVRFCAFLPCQNGLQKGANFAESHEDVNAEKLTVKKWWIFGAIFCHGLRRVFHGLQGT